MSNSQMGFAAIVILCFVVGFAGLLFKNKRVDPVPIQPISHTEKPVRPESEPVKPAPQFVLSYNCPQQRSVRFNTKEEADQFQKTLDRLDFDTRYYRWQLLPRPEDPNDLFNNPFNRREEPVYHLIYYKTDSIKTKSFDSLDSARLWELKLRDWGCVTNIEEG